MDNFTHPIYRWYHTNKRDLPWRKTSDAYRIWISEIILQQTRIAQGIAYYLRFTEAFPTVEELANADEHQVLKMWQGLGYYSRARNLHAAAKIIVKYHGSVFPNKYENIIKLKGIGPYTAAAIASIAFNLSYPTVDGNIYRVLSRYFGIDTPINTNQGKKEFQLLAEELINDSNPGFHNQVLMEFGALQCTPKSPKCRDCPVCETCFAFQNNTVDQLPVKLKKTKQHDRFFIYYLIDSGDFIFLEKRTGNDIWKNLYQLPLIESGTSVSNEEILAQPVAFIENGDYNIKWISEQKKHILSHQVIHAKLIYVEVGIDVNITSPLIQVNKKDISKFAVPRLVEQFLTDANLVDH